MINDIQLSPHFWLSEFTRSGTAEREGIDNTPPSDVVERLRVLCVMVLEPLRAAVGCPLRVSSGYRSPELNAAINGSRGSRHMTGEAADVMPMRDSLTSADLLDGCKAFDGWDKAITYAHKPHLHVSIRTSKPRGLIYHSPRSGVYEQVDA